MTRGYQALSSACDADSSEANKPAPPLTTPQNLTEEVDRILTHLQPSKQRVIFNQNDMECLAHQYAAAMQSGPTHPHYHQILKYEQNLHLYSLDFQFTFRNRHQKHQWQLISLFYKTVCTIAQTKHLSYDAEALGTGSEIIDEFQTVDTKNVWQVSVLKAKYRYVQSQQFVQRVSGVPDDSKLEAFEDKIRSCYLALTPLRQLNMFFFDVISSIEDEVKEGKKGLK